MEEYHKQFIKGLSIWIIKTIWFILKIALVIAALMLAGTFCSIFSIPLITVVCIILYIRLTHKERNN